MKLPKRAIFDSSESLWFLFPVPTQNPGKILVLRFADHCDVKGSSWSLQLQLSWLWYPFCCPLLGTGQRINTPWRVLPETPLPPAKAAASRTPLGKGTHWIWSPRLTHCCFFYCCCTWHTSWISVFLFKYISIFYSSLSFFFFFFQLCASNLQPDLYQTVEAWIKPATVFCFFGFYFFFSTLLFNLWTIQNL